MNSPMWMAPERGNADPEVHFPPYPAASGQENSLDTNAERSPLLSVAYFGVVAFIVVYFFSPALWVPGLAGIPFAKISGGMALLAFVLGYMSSRDKRLPKEIKALLLLLLQLCLAVPFAYWRGGAIKVVLPLDGFLGITLMTIAITFALDTVRRLRALIFIETAAMVFFAVTAIMGHSYETNYAGDQRLTGVLNGLFTNSNDFALGMVMVIPFCFMFHALAKSMTKKILWTAAIALLAYGVMGTYSRGGFLGLVAVVIICLRDFGAKRRKWGLPLLLAFGFACLVATSPSYQARIKSIVEPDLDPTGSRDQRTYLLKQGLNLTITHPLLGVGPGCFEPLSGVWHVAHNNYLQLSSEAGILALLFFLMMLRSALRTLKRVEESASFDYQMVAIGIKASLWGFCVCGFFASMVYSFGPYFLIAYTAALGRIVLSTFPAAGKLPGQTEDSSGMGIRGQEISAISVFPG
jgi:O-antigen ligase